MTFNSIFDPQNISLVVAIIVSLIILVLALSVVRAIWRNDIKLDYLLSESTSQHSASGTIEAPKASLSRFQFLVFTFVIAGLYLVLSLETGTLIDIPESALVLIGISSVTYAAGKAMNGKPPEIKTPADKDGTSQPPSTPTASEKASEAAQAAAAAEQAANHALTAAREAKAAAAAAGALAQPMP